MEAAGGAEGPRGAIEKRATSSNEVGNSSLRHPMGGGVRPAAGILPGVERTIPFSIEIVNPSRPSLPAMSCP
jgi:hypothetical protein